MTNWGARALAAGMLVLAVGLAGAACYKPNIQDGGLLCSDAGACPEGFHCAGDGTCRQGGEMMCLPSSPHIDPICPARPGDDCDPICQSRCPCGRCNLDGSKLSCTPAGNKPTGATCNPASDDCSPGNVCLKDCEDKTARCFRFCANGGDSASVCGTQPCDNPVYDKDNMPTALSVCQPPTRACNPVGDPGDCGDPALSCYITSTGATVCDCRGPGQPDGDCGPYNSCIAGYRCVSFGTPPRSRCFKTCLLIGGSDCTAPTVCKQAPGSGTYGYCDTP
jgi:hypothetical protein